RRLAQRRRSKRRLVADGAGHARFRGRARRRNRDCGELLLRLSVPLSRRRPGLRAIHAESVGRAEPQIPLGALVMKTASPALIAFLDAARAAPDSAVAFADCYTFTLMTGLALTYANTDQPVAYNGAVFAANGPLVQGLKYRCSVGLEVDKQQLTIAARPTDLVGGAMFLAALRDGAFDGCRVQRDRVFMAALGEPPIG